MSAGLPIRSALYLYDKIWGTLLLFLRHNRRLGEGFAQRTLKSPLEPADLWIQAASVGEVYLALEIIKRLCPVNNTRILLTTNTRQGMEIIAKTASDLDPTQLRVQTRAAYCPLDRPSIMLQAVQQVSPQVVVLLESEIWPAMLSALKKAAIPVLIINGRMTARSLKHYRIWPGLWRWLQPAEVMAISQADAARFADLFKGAPVSTMHNIKFDRLSLPDAKTPIETDLNRLLGPQQPFVVLGSVRQQEEDLIARIIRKLHNNRPGAVIGLFPRHSHRISFWQKTLGQLNLSLKLRSQWKKPLKDGGVILWDTFGELGRAYESAQAAFVGGSLAPLGGQNFLEPLIYGVRPVIGPYWDNFKWVGDRIFDQDLVRSVKDWQTAAEMLIVDLMNPVDRKATRKAAWKYIKQHQGGTEQACRIIRKYLNI